MSSLIHSKIIRLAARLASADITWVLHRLRLAFGLRGLIPRPVPLVSRCVEGGGTQKRNEETSTRLLVFSHNLDREGASISLKELVCGLKDRQGILSEVIAFSDGPLRFDYERHGIPVEVLPSMLNRISTIKRLDKEIKLLASRINASSADVVFVNTLLNFPAVLAAEEAGVPSVWNPRESEPWDSYFRFLPDPVAQQAIAAIGLPRCVVFVADSTRSVWKDFEQAANFKVIHNALNLDRFVESTPKDKASVRRSLEWSADEVVFLCVGTLCERKGQQDAILALETIANRLVANIRLVFVGENSERYGQALRHAALRLHENDRIRICFETPTERIGNYYFAADAFLLCSRVESYPRVILEALAFGLPIISTPVFGVAEQLPNDADAFFYSPGDVTQLGEQILEMANSPMLRQRLNERAKARFAELPSFDQMLKSYAEIIQNVRRCGP